MKQNSRYEIDMCSGSILKKMLLFAIPLMLSSILQLLFNAADIIVVGRYAGDNSLAAVGSNTALINLLTNLFVGLSVGANVVAARYYGAKEEKNLSQTVHTSIFLALISGAVLTVVGVGGARQILIWMQTPPEVLDLAVVYLRFIFGGITATMLYNFGAALLRAIGDTRRPLYFLLGAGVINAGLNLLLVIVFRMDVAGVGIATAISQCISAGLVLWCLHRETGGIHLDFTQLRIYRDKLSRILRVGLPAGVQGIIFALSNVVIQSSVNSLGNIVMAGSAAAANIEGFVYMSMNAFYQTILSFTSQNAGAGQLRRINRILLTGLACTTVTGLIVGGLAVLLGEPLLSIYSKDPVVVAAGLERLRIISSTYAICGLMDGMVGALRGIGYSVIPMLVSLAGACGLRLVWIATVFRMIPTASVIYWSYPVSWIVTFLCHVVCYMIVKRRLDRRFQALEAARNAQEAAQPSGS